MHTLMHPLAHPQPTLEATIHDPRSLGSKRRINQDKTHDNRMPEAGTYPLRLIDDPAKIRGSIAPSIF